MNDKNSRETRPVPLESCIVNYIEKRIPKGILIALLVAGVSILFYYYLIGKIGRSLPEEKIIFLNTAPLYLILFLITSIFVLVLIWIGIQIKKTKVVED